MVKHKLRPIEPNQSYTTISRIFMSFDYCPVCGQEVHHDNAQGWCSSRRDAENNHYSYYGDSFIVRSWRIPKNASCPLVDTEDEKIEEAEPEEDDEGDDCY